MKSRIYAACHVLALAFIGACTAPPAAVPPDSHDNDITDSTSIPEVVDVNDNGLVDCSGFDTNRDNCLCSGVWLMDQCRDGVVGCWCEDVQE